LCNVALESSTEPPVSSRYDAPVIAAERTKKWPREFRGHSNDFLRGYAKAYALDTKAYVLETKAYAPADICAPQVHAYAYKMHVYGAQDNPPRVMRSGSAYPHLLYPQL